MNNNMAISKDALLQTMKAARLEIEATKYVDILSKKEAELDLA